MFNKRRILLALIFTLIVVAMLGSAFARQDLTPTNPGQFAAGKPTELVMKRGATTTMDLRKLPQIAPEKRERPEREDPDIERTEIKPAGNPKPEVVTPSVPAKNAPAPAPIMNFDGLDFMNWGAGHPPDTNGDVGPTYYIQTINTSIGIFRKSDGVRVAAFTFNTFMSQANFGDVRDSGNFGDPVVLYDTFEDRWVITDFAFTLDAGGNVVNPPGAFEVIAVSKTSDPVMGGWNFYSINTAGGLGDYPKLGIWPDGLYMSVNMFGYPKGAPFQGPRVYAFNKAQMYAGNPTAQVVTFNGPPADFTLLPSNARLQVGTPPPGTPNYFVSSWEFLNALTVYKFHVDWNRLSLSTFTGPDVPLAATSWPNATVPNALSSGGNALDVLQIRAMAQNQYSNIGGVESLWAAHTVRRQDTTGLAAPRWYQVNVTGGTVNANLPQAATWDPDGSNVISRFMPSVAVDRAGDMALGYSTSSSTTKPAIKYAGRLAGDPVNTLSQTEQVLIQGAGTQAGNCGGAACIRWGDYSSMTLDPDGCTFWYTSMYYATDGLNHQTRIGSFSFGSCTPVGAGGTVSGTVTATAGGAAISGATVMLGSRTTTTDGSGGYSFTNIPAGTYPVIMASSPGYNSATFTSVGVSDGATTTKNFSLGAAPTSACPTDTTQLDFQTGVPTNTDLATSPGDVTLLNAPFIDQQNTAGTTTGTGFGTPAWTGQTFIAGVTGQLVKADIQLFCNGCGATPPNLTLSVRNTSGGLPTGADLNTATIPGSAFASGSTVTYTATFGAPATITSGTQYALILRPVSAPAGSGYFWIRSSPTTYANGSRVLSADSGGTWSADTTRDYNFKTYMQTGFAASGDLISGLKDSNPSAGLTPVWTTLSWTATTPANTAVRFQIAASNSDIGPFNFVGPDGTAATFFTTSGAALGQFTGNRYLKYRANLTTTDSTMTPTLNDVTICYSNLDCSNVPTITPGAAQACPNSTGNTASGPAGASSYNWSITNGTITGGGTSQTVTYTAGASGNVNLMLSLTTANGCPGSNSVNVPILAAPTPPTVNATTNGTGTQDQACPEQPLTLTATSTGATSYQWYKDGSSISGETSSTTIVTAAGSYTVTATNACGTTEASAGYVVHNPTPNKPVVTPGGPTTFCTGGSVTLMSDSPTGIQWYKDNVAIVGAGSQSYVATTTGSYTAVLNALGCHSQTSDPTVVTVNPIPATPTVTPGGPTTFCSGGSVTLTSSSASGNQWYLNGNPIGGATANTYNATATGSYTVVVTASGCSSAASSATSVTVNPTPATPTVTPGGPTTFCAGGSVTLTSSSASGNQWYLNSNPIGGATANTYNATASGNYTVVVTASGCTSAPSAATAVTSVPAQTATAGGSQSIAPNGTTGGLGGNTPSSGTGTWTIQSGGTGTFSNLHAGNSTFTHTGGSGPVVLRWTISNPPCADSFAQVSINIGVAPTITCPASPVVVNATTGQCQAVVSFTVNSTGVPAPTVTCTPPSGSIFPVGTTTVSCSATNGVGSGATCSFAVQVKDTQPPVFTNGCPPAINLVVPITCPLTSSLSYNYALPAVADNCPGVSVSCSPPPGAVFALGTTTVSCTATDTSGNTATCGFAVSLWSGCLQDETNPGNVCLFNAQTGQYQFCCNGQVIATGSGSVTLRGCVVSISHTKDSRRVQMTADMAAKRGTAAVQIGTKTTCTVTDQNISNNTCQCPVIVSH
jgi:Carboxypeptidase regulatory-like domain/HYR domain/Ig-like domain CHU_C associated